MSKQTNSNGSNPKTRQEHKDESQKRRKLNDKNRKVVKKATDHHIPVPTPDIEVCRAIARTDNLDEVHAILLPNFNISQDVLQLVVSSFRSKIRNARDRACLIESYLRRGTAAFRFENAKKLLPILAKRASRCSRCEDYGHIKKYCPLPPQSQGGNA